MWTNDLDKIYRLNFKCILLLYAELSQLVQYHVWDMDSIQKQHTPTEVLPTAYKIYKKLQHHDFRKKKSTVKKKKEKTVSFQSTNKRVYNWM